MTNLKCPFCQQELRKIHPAYVICDNCRITGEDKLWQELICARKELEQSETCCTEWEKQALDYKAENIALSSDLERTRKALDVAVDTVKEIDELLSSNRFDVKEVPLLNITQTKISLLLKCINTEQITAILWCKNGNC